MSQQMHNHDPLPPSLACLAAPPPSHPFQRGGRPTLDPCPWSTSPTPPPASALSFQKFGCRKALAWQISSRSWIARATQPQLRSPLFACFFFFWGGGGDVWGGGGGRGGGHKSEELMLVFEGTNPSNPNDHSSCSFGPGNPWKSKPKWFPSLVYSHHNDLVHTENKKTICNIRNSLFIGFHPSQLVQDFVHAQCVLLILSTSEESDPTG